MSTFAVTIEKIDKVWEHDNADRLELASIVGQAYQFVVAKDVYSEGDKVVYFPVDSLLPVRIVEALGLVGRLSHGPSPSPSEERPQNRVKTVKLRGKISQGLVCSPSTLVEAFPFEGSNLLGGLMHVGIDLTELLDVTKYEPPVIPSKHGNLVSLPELVGKYDIEGAQGYVSIVDSLMDTKVYITEKVEGSHWWATINTKNEIRVGQRNYCIESVAGGVHTWHKVMETQQLKDKLIALFYGVGAATVTIRGEMLGPGVQGNYYGLKDHKVLIFEIEFNGDPVHASDFVHFADDYGLERVPCLLFNNTLREWFDYLECATLVEASNGMSKLAGNKRREGVVIKPMVEARDDDLGRVLVKQRSPEYLAKSDT